MFTGSENPENKIYILIRNGEPVLIGSMSCDQFNDELHEKIWDKSHKKAEKDKISLLKALKIQIKRTGFIPEEVTS